MLCGTGELVVDLEIPIAPILSSDREWFGDTEDKLNIKQYLLPSISKITTHPKLNPQMVKQTIPLHGVQGWLQHPS